jgi:tetratricopeptide (TPR) repeat protein
VFAGSFDLAAVHSVCAEEGQSAAQVAALTGRLVEKSLLSKVDDGGGYQLLETIRQYATQQLTAAGELDAVRDRHARFHGGVALQACNALMSGYERPHIEVIARIDDNLRVALARLLVIEPRSALELAASLFPAWWVRGRLREGTGWVERALAAAPDAPPELLARARFAHGFLIVQDAEDWDGAARSIDVGIDLLVNAGESPPILGMLMSLRAECDVFLGDVKSARARAEAGLAIVRRYPETRDAWPDVFCMFHVAHVKRTEGELEAAIALFTDCGEAARRRGIFAGQIVAFNAVGELWEKLGALEKAREAWELTLRCRREINAVDVGTIHGSMPRNLLALARVAARQGDLAAAASLSREALPIAQELRDEAAVQEIGELLARTVKVEEVRSAMLRPEGGVWHITFAGKSIHVPDMKGLWHLRELVSRPRETVSALSLIAAEAEDPVPVGDAGPLLDREALRQYRRRLAELDEALEDAEVAHDISRHAKLSAERAALLKELARATGLGGKARRTGSPTEKARLNVTRTIRHAIAYLATAHPELGTHLEESISTGVACSYEPRANVAWAI